MMELINNLVVATRKRDELKAALKEIKRSKAPEVHACLNDRLKAAQERVDLYARRAELLHIIQYRLDGGTWKDAGVKDRAEMDRIRSVMSELQGRPASVMARRLCLAPEATQIQ